MVNHTPIRQFFMTSLRPTPERGICGGHFRIFTGDDVVSNVRGPVAFDIINSDRTDAEGAQRGQQGQRTQQRKQFLYGVISIA